MLFIFLENEEYSRDLVDRSLYCSLTLNKLNVLFSLLGPCLESNQKACSE